jgi:diacylglycerol kinase (ATP)
MAHGLHPCTTTNVFVIVKAPIVGTAFHHDKTKPAAFSVWLRRLLRETGSLCRRNPMNAPQRFSVPARLCSFTHALRGLKELVQSQHNARVHAAAAIVAVMAGVGFRLSTIEWCAIVLSIVIVWTAEAFNTALEFLTDLSSPEFHVLAGKAKDVAAASVLIAAFGAVVIGGIVFIPHILVLTAP